MGKNLLEEWSRPHGQPKCLKCSTWVRSQKRQNELCFQGKPFSITVMQVCALTRNAEEAKIVQFYEDLQDLPGEVKLLSRV